MNDEEDADPAGLLDAPPVDADPAARASWERGAAYLPPGPPYDAPERMRAILSDVEYLIRQQRVSQQLSRSLYDRMVAYEDALRKIVMAADCGRSLTKHLEVARELLPPTRYKRPPR